MIVAMTPERVIGRAGTMPWHLPADLRWFRENTLHKPIIMGRATWDSIGKALPQRHNIVVSRQPSLKLVGATVVSSLTEALALVSDIDEVMIIGGGQIYRQALTYANRLYLTLIHEKIVGDTYFPDYNPDEWSVSFSHICTPTLSDPAPCSFMILERTQ